MLHRAIVAELRAGMTQAELVKITGYTRETLRSTARAAGLPPASAGIADTAAADTASTTTAAVTNRHNGQHTPEPSR